MEHKRFSLFDALMWAIRSFFDNFRLFGGTLIVAVGIFVAWLLVLLLISRFTFFLHQVPDMREFLWQFKLSGVLQPRTTEIHFPLITGFGFFIALGTAFMVSLLALGYTKICLLFHDKSQEVSFATLFTGWRHIGTFLITGILFGLMFVVGLSLLILPGIYLILRFGFFKYLIVDRDAGVIESLRMSYAITAGYEWEMLGLLVISFLVLKFLLLWPIVELMYVAVYRKLLPA
ncbi:hypothetical protein CVU75_00260 [Candidatus Dependentiae bacterium HGW-Dependentiae-1]|nr:MAG: hypothetical protein CVU75_00260 [Candidatus Dependentiae bacterium HGW-Dependentiae-1]